MKIIRVMKIITEAGLVPVPPRQALRGIGSELPLYEIR
jgi:hypothetical protein